MEELTQEEILRVLAEAREENRRYHEIARRRTEVVDEIQRLCNEYLQLKAGKITERCDYKLECDFCNVLNEANEQNIRLKEPPVYCELNGVQTSFRYCPNCGRKL